jgi:hypothetical protein
MFGRISSIYWNMFTYGFEEITITWLYWSKDPVFKCPLISHLMTRDRYELITRCLHVANAPADVQDPSSNKYDKMHKLRWMIDEVRNRFQCMWSPNQQMTVDEGMIMYKGRYCPIRFGIKVWAATDALSTYLWDFEVYYGKTSNPHDDDSDLSTSCSTAESSNSIQQPWGGKGEGLSGRNVVKTLMGKLGSRGHIITTDNYFTSVPLFLDLLSNGTMATGTLRWNRNMFLDTCLQRK